MTRDDLMEHLCRLESLAAEAKFHAKRVVDLAEHAQAKADAAFSAVQDFIKIAQAEDVKTK